MTAAEADDNGGDDDDGQKSPSSSPFLRGALYLSSKYSHIRRVRGDGNCYYRSFLYAVCESTLGGLSPPAVTAAEADTNVGDDDDGRKKRGEEEYRRLRSLGEF